MSGMGKCLGYGNINGLTRCSKPKAFTSSTTSWVVLIAVTSTKCWTPRSIINTWFTFGREGEVMHAKVLVQISGKYMIHSLYLGLHKCNPHTCIKIFSLFSSLRKSNELQIIRSVYAPSLLRRVLKHWILHLLLGFDIWQIEVLNQGINTSMSKKPQTPTDYSAYHDRGLK